LIISLNKLSYVERLKAVATNTGRRTCSPLATNTGRQFLLT